MSRKQPYPIADLTKGLHVSVDALLISDGASPNMDRVRFDRGILRKDFEYKVFGYIPERPMYIDTFYKTDGNEYTIVLGAASAYEYASSELTQITGSNVFTGSYDDVFSTATYNDLFIVTNGKDAIQKYDGATWGALGGCATILAKRFIVFYDHLIMGHTIESSVACPQRVRWSDTGEPEQWDEVTYPNAGFYDLVDTVDWVVAFVLLRDRLFVFKERSIWEFLHVGGTQIFEYRLVIDGIGTYAPHALESLGEEVILYGSDNLYVFDGNSIRGVGDKIYSWLYATEYKKVASSYLYKAPARFIEETGEYVIAVPTTGDDPDWLIKYNTVDESFTQRTLEVSCIGYNTVGGRTTWAAATGAWSASEWDVSWKYKALPPGAPTMLYGSTDGIIYEDDRITTQAYRIWLTDARVWEDITDLWSSQRYDTTMFWESKDFMFGHAARVVECHIQVRGCPLSLYYSVDKGVTWSSAFDLTPSETELREMVVDLNVTCQRIRFKISATGDDLEVKWLEPWYIQRKRSKLVYR